LHQVTIRAVTLLDVDVVFRLLCKFATSYEPPHAAFDRNYAKLLENEGTDLLVAEQDGSVVGYVLASDSLTLFANGVVTELYVEEDRRGSRIGRALV
jgi:ribosomal protein S18 acetylase RimI-like enzyme